MLSITYSVILFSPFVNFPKANFPFSTDSITRAHCLVIFRHHIEYVKEYYLLNSNTVPNNPSVPILTNVNI